MGRTQAFVWFKDFRTIKYQAISSRCDSEVEKVTESVRNDL
jgi:hypothetical protein